MSVKLTGMNMNSTLINESGLYSAILPSPLISTLKMIIIMSNIVFIENNEVVTDSLMVAEVFGKRHDNVMSDINKLIGYSSDEFSLLNFQESTYINERARQYKKYNLTKDGFTLLVMGFTGEEALKFKMMYINEFNRMEQELRNRDLNSYMIDDPIARAERWIKEQQEKQ
ncbi:Rha family transcriptional regulator [Stenotrophomonas maltophilia group sp. RNC7]|uniref:Phage regulatory protein Rha (Phage_pRha) n=3 Tax=Bacillaceae TaxID=186817 RepID=A0A1Y5Z3N2_9BACI|nr:Rha family transcriptional regulator [Stenotrophomonas maltophilia group sp. RNC7]MDQ4678400.1 Rha family transcriptional regulator [Stenotrophomonas maltophilia group sp. RNC7]SMD78569.1 Phage regulatory protein Rha (Phage_pRha) [Bacillus pacificus]